MLSHGILNAQLASAIARLRHKDLFAISDCGLPVPPGVEVIDLALVFGVPRFEEALRALRPHVVLEEGVMAREAQGTQAERWVSDILDVPLSYIPHNNQKGFKAYVKEARFVLRTGETTPYANVILRCGVPF